MDERAQRFERLVVPHLDAAYNLARWLTRNDHDAQDIVQDSALRALRFLDGLRGEDARPWLLGIVRNATWSWLQANRPAEAVSRDDDDGEPQLPAPASDEPHNVAVRRAESRLLNEAVAALPPALREVIVLREMEDLAYKDIAGIAGVPIGTVMSRLSRARRLLTQSVKVIEAAADRQGTR